MKKTKTLHFKTKAGYQKYVAYGNIHHVFKHRAPYEKIVIHGKVHHVNHLTGACKTCKRKHY